MKTKLKWIAFMTCLVMVNVAETRAQQNRTQLNLEAHLAIQGYDPVAYFAEHKAVKGLKKYSVNAEGALYYFSTDEHKQIFLKDFKRYEPQYGGWCAYAMGASGEKVEVDPETFKVVDGKLYLFYNKYFNNTLTKWNAHERALKEKADKNWAEIIKE